MFIESSFGYLYSYIRSKLNWIGFEVFKGIYGMNVIILSWIYQTYIASIMEVIPMKY